jgi:nitrite reductase/ring-hydroxylating ferredoxin subunit
MNWIRGAAIDAIREKPFVFKSSAKQIAVFLVGESVYAVDNRCPHEGYPLAAGKISGPCVLTCNWHNWKFRLDTGECVIGGDDVRTYPTRITEGHVWIDITDPPPEESQRRILRGLRGAFDDRDFGRICRETARLHFLGVDASTAVARALEWAHDRLEFGTTHAFAAAADWLHLASLHSGDPEKRLICFSEAVDHFAFDSLRMPRFPYSEPGSEPVERSGFLAAVENEDSRRAEAITARMLESGIHWPDIEETFAAAAFAHFNDFGHSAIYVFKTGELIEALGPSIERFVLPPLARHLCHTTREDLLPEFKGYPAAVALAPEPVGGSHAGESLAVPFPATLKSALEWVRSGLELHSVEEIYDRLIEALALNLLCYDTSYDSAYDGPVSQNIGWLDFTHGITMANAARRLCSRYPRLWKPALIQLACMLGRNHEFIDADLDRSKCHVDDTAQFLRDVHELLFDHGERDPIFSAHLLKTSMAVADELKTASEACSQALTSALNRFLHSPIKRKHVRRLARQAINLVSRDFENQS